MEITKELAVKVLKVVDQGLVRGVGQPIPGKMCVEAAVCYAMGLPHGDEPTCVGSAVRQFKIRLNDSPWSSEAARAKGMRKLAIAQLGSDQIDQVAFAQEVALETVRQIVPIALRAAASVNLRHAAALEAAAVACEAAVDLNTARADAYAAARAAARAAAYATYAATYAAAHAAEKKDSVLKRCAKIGLQALVKLAAPGVAFLDLCGEDEE